jgi:hypothetical protein
MTRRPRPPAAGGWPRRAPKDGSIAAATADRTYIGLRDPDGTAHVAVEDRRGRKRPLRHAAVHSPAGFQWGYGYRPGPRPPRQRGPGAWGARLSATFIRTFPHPAGSSSHRSAAQEAAFVYGARRLGKR